METTLSLIMALMHEYQKTNNVKKECITNTQYLYDCMKANFPASNARAKAVICVKTDEKNESNTFIVHMVIMVNERIYDPSYEINSLENVVYHDNIKKLISSFDNIKDIPTSAKQVLSNTFTQFIEFTKKEDEINNNGLLICDKKFYNDQADYIEEYLKKNGILNVSKYK